MCKKLIYVVVLVSVFGLTAAQAQEEWIRAAYWDSRYPGAWGAGGAAGMRDALEAAGYTILDADELKTWMDDRIADRKLSVVVFCLDVAPDTVCETMDANCTLRRYLNAGGKIVWYADWCIYYQGHSDGTMDTWGGGGASAVLGFDASSGPNDSGEVVVFTAAGINWGLTQTWTSQRPTSPTITSNLTPLATISSGSAAAWVKHYVAGDKYRGFVRLWDTSGTPSPEDVMRLAEFMARKASNPSPPDGATGVTVPLLQWEAGATAAFHDVYFGTNPTPGPDEFQVQQNVSTTVYYHAAGPTPGTTYYWRIDEVEADGTTIHTGDIWSFSVPPSTAYDPDPPDGAEFVNTEVELSWTAGLSAALHDIYFGTDETEVTNGTGDTFKVTWPLTTFSPGTLQKDTTYYWRIDEIETDMTTKHKGEVWSFKTIPDIPIGDPSLIGWWKLDEGQGDMALDSSGHDHHGTLIGDPQWVAGYHGGALEFDGDNHVDCGNDPSLDITAPITIMIWARPSVAGETHSTNPGVIAKAESGVGWSWQLRYKAVGTPGYMGFQFNPVSGDRVWVHVGQNLEVGEWHHIAGVADGTNAICYLNGGETDRQALADFQSSNGKLFIGYEGWIPWYGAADDAKIYNRALTQEEIKQAMRGDPLLAWDPSPVNGSTPDIDGATPLSWKPGEKAAQHDVYLGTDETAVKNADTSDTTGIYRVRQAATSYTPPEAIQWGQTYHWRIDEVNTDATINTGRVWTFTVADYLIVDDFESYDDYCARIFYAWKDGWGYSADADCGVTASTGNGTGSTVGNLAAPYAEQTIVHGGNQSMPYEYNNTGTGGKARYSEASLEFATPQNWTRNDVKALALWFHGETGNDPESLYVTLEDSARQVRVATHPDPEALQIPTWQQWNIALTQFSGVNLASIKKVYLGVGNRNNPQAGGSGKLYIDDIRIYPARCVPSLAKPAEDLSDNCIVDYADVEIVSDQWLDSGFMVTPTDPGTSGLIAHYAFNGNANDVVGGHNGTTSGIVSYTAGKVGQAILLDGVDDMVTVGPVGISGAAPRTISGWVRANATIDSLPNWIDIFGFVGPQADPRDNMSFDMEIGEAQGRRGYVIHVYGWERVILDVDFEWHHLAASFDGTTIAWYGDGLLGGTDDSRPLDTRDQVHMGKRDDNANYFPGRVDEVRIFNRVLSEAQIAWLAGHTSPLSIPADLYQDDVIDFKDLAVLGDAWLDKILWP